MNNSLLETIFHHILDSPAWFTPFGIEFLAISKHVVILWIVTAIIIAVLLYTVRSVQKDKLKLGGRLALSLGLLLNFIRQDILGSNFSMQESKRWVPFFSTLFLFIMMSNLFGLIPFSATITGNISTTLILGFFTFIAMQIFGMSKKGIVQYWLHLVPKEVPKVIWPIMFVIELVGLFTKWFALTVRLFANMIAGHIIILVFLSLGAQLAGSWIQLGVAPFTVLAACAVNLLEIFIAILQAYIFTFLSAIFVASAGEAH